MKLGLALTLTTAVCWGILPIALKLALQGMDPATITWYRFTVAALLLGIILAVTGSLPNLKSLSRSIWLLLLLAIIGLVTTVVSAFYYLRIVKVIYFDEPNEAFDENYDWGLKISLILSSILILIYFIYPSVLTGAVSSIIIF